ncbi:MAG: RNA polymerase Rpb4 family protein [Candidatus Methanomethylophilaceae archaeon]|jgi:DNA-directed RNA polymerase subunit F
MAEKYVSLAEVGELLTSDKEARGLLVVQNAAMEHAQAVSRLSAEDTRNLIEELKEVPLVTDFTAVKIADVLPKYPVDLRAIFSKERVVLEPEDSRTILEIVAKYL